jgi:VWFA-related protein
MNPRRLFVACVSGLVLSSFMVAGAQQPVFRTETNFIEVVASVTNKDGEFVTGLSAADFEIREMGRRESIDTFSMVELPMGTAAVNMPPARFSADIPVDQREADGRLYMLYVTGATGGQNPYDRRLVTRFIQNHLQPGDRAAIWDTMYPTQNVRFSSDKAALLAELDTQSGQLPTGGFRLPFAYHSSALADPDRELTKAIDWYNGVQGRRKSIIVFSPGWMGQSGAVTRSDITLYAVDTRGLVAPDRNDLSARGLSGAEGAAAVGRNLSAISNSVEGLLSLARQTGGFAIVNDNDFEPGFKKIVEANSRYYVLGYASSYKRQDRVYRELDVKVKRPGVKVHARRGYFPRQ